MTKRPIKIDPPVDRFSINDPEWELFPSDSGDYVLYADYAALQSECAQLREMIDKLVGGDDDIPRYSTKRLRYEIDSQTEALRAELRIAEAFVREHDYCCCGMRMSDHDIGSGHSPVSEYDYAHSKAIERAEAAEKRLIEVPSVEHTYKPPEGLDNRTAALIIAAGARDTQEALNAAAPNGTDGNRGQS